MFRRLVTLPTQRNKVAQLETKLRLILKSDHMMYFCRWNKPVMTQAFLTEIVITLQCHEANTSPCGFVIKPTFFKRPLVLGAPVGWVISGSHSCVLIGRIDSGEPFLPSPQSGPS